MGTPKLFGVEIPFVHHLGFELAKMEGGESELTFAPNPAPPASGLRVSAGLSCRSSAMLIFHGQRAPISRLIHCIRE